MNKKYAVLCLGVFLLGLGLGRFSLPDRQEESKKTESTTEKTVTEREITRPDGTKEKERIVSDKKETKKETIKITTNDKPKWKASALGGIDFSRKEQVYGGALQMRVLGNLSGGVWATTTGITHNTAGGLIITYEW